MPQMMPQAMAAPSSPVPVTAAAPVKEEVKAKESFDLKLVSFNADDKIKVIKEVRAVTGLGLKEVQAPNILSTSLFSFAFFRPRI